MDFLPVSSPSITVEDVEAVARCVRDGWISSEGPQVKEFESQFASLIGRKYGVAVSNGTAAIDIALEALSVGPGDEVILPSFTIVSCLNQILRSGAKPVFIDALPDTWNLDPVAVEEALTPQTKAIIVVHLYGLPADIDVIMEFASIRGIPVIEDAAEAHGQHLNGKPLGSYGDLSTFSFYSNKLITTGEGGMLLTDDQDLAERAQSLRNLAFRPNQRFVHDDIGWNYRLTAMQAALGLSQIARIDELLAFKQHVGKHYQKLLAGVEGIELPTSSYRGSLNVYWVFGVVLRDFIPVSAKEIMAALHDIGVGTRPFFFPLHRQPVLQQYGYGAQRALPVSENLGERGFYIPNGADLTPNDQQRVVESLAYVLSRY